MFWERDGVNHWPRCIGDDWGNVPHLVERTPDVNGAVLDDLIHHFRDGLGEVRVGKLGLSEDKDDVLH